MTTTAKKPAFSIMAVSPETACAKGYEFELQHPFNEGEGLGMFITVIGPESATMKAHQRSKINEQLRIEAKGNAPAVTVEVLEKSAIENAIAATVSWRGVVYDEADGEMPFTEENARLLYSQAFVRKQVLDASGDLGNFTPN